MSKTCKEETGLDTALDILVGKWKPVILYHIYTKGIIRFSELQRAIPAITKKMLTTQLRELEYHDILVRKIYPQIPPKVEYSMSEYGKGLFPILEILNTWGMAHINHIHEIYGEQIAQSVSE